MNTPNIDAMMLLCADLAEAPVRMDLSFRHNSSGYVAQIRAVVPNACITPLGHPDDGDTLLCTGPHPTAGDALTALEALCARKPVERWAFWTYDLFPLMLGGRIQEPAHLPGYYRVEGYGHSVFKPFAVLEGPQGRALKRNLDAIREEYRKAEADLERSFLGRWRAELKRNGIEHPYEKRWSGLDAVF